jgi:uracil-DNA glycosylase family 4
MQRDRVSEAIEELKSYMLRAQGRGLEVVYRNVDNYTAGGVKGNFTERENVEIDDNVAGGVEENVIERENIKVGSDAAGSVEDNVTERRHVEVDDKIAGGVEDNVTGTGNIKADERGTTDSGEKQAADSKRRKTVVGFKEVGIKRIIKTASQPGLFGQSEGEKTDGLDGMNLEELSKEVSRCTRCSLSAGRTNTVFGAGNPGADIIFIGEAPGKEEDLQGIPFVGRAGKLLTRMLAAIDLKREDVFIGNILKCRPPQNRDPLEEEVVACEPFLVRQIELIKPHIICALGRVAAQNLLKTKLSLSKMRGKIHYYGDTMVLVTYHPAALLRNPHFKKPAWEDLQKLREIHRDYKGG